MMATAFLGYDNSPKWYKYNNNIFNTNKYINKYNALSPKNFNTHKFILKRDSSSVSSTTSSVSNFLLDKNLNPVYIYENLRDESTRKQVLLDTKGLSGIYLILNKVTMDYYIGSASTGRFYARFSNHLFNFTGSKIVKLAVKKYNISEFVFIILELFPEIVNKENNKNLLDLEDFYLKSLLPNYNILTEAASSFGYKHTEIARLKMSSSYSIERRMRIGNLNKDKKFSEETINLMREKALVREPIDYSNEAKKNMRQKSKSVIVYNLDSTVYGEYPSIKEAAASLNCSDKTLNRALKSSTHLLKRR